MNPEVNLIETASSLTRFFSASRFGSRFAQRQSPLVLPLDIWGEVAAFGGPGTRRTMRTLSQGIRDISECHIRAVQVFNEAGLRALQRPGYFAHVEHLALWCCTQADLQQMAAHLRADNDVVAIPPAVPFLAVLPALRSLSVAAAGLNSAAMLPIAAMPQLTELNLRTNQIDDAGALILRQMHGLRSLNVAHNCVDTDGVCMLLSHPALTCLDITGTAMSAGACARLAANDVLTELRCGALSRNVSETACLTLRDHRTLTYIHLSCTISSSRDASQVAQIPALRSLQAWWGQPGATIVDTLLHDTAIQSLNIRGAALTAEDIIAIARNDQITRLALSCSASYAPACYTALIRNTSITDLDIAAPESVDQLVALISRPGLQRLTLLGKRDPYPPDVRADLLTRWTEQGRGKSRLLL